jgi:IS30 family transposase
MKLSAAQNMWRHREFWIHIHTIYNWFAHGESGGLHWQPNLHPPTCGSRMEKLQINLHKERHKNYFTKF